MPALIGVNEFVDETRDDYNSPTTSTFVSRMGQCRHTIAALEEVLVALVHYILAILVFSYVVINSAKDEIKVVTGVSLSVDTVSAYYKYLLPNEC